MPELLTPKQVAEQLNVSVDTVKRYLRTGRMPGVRIGIQWRIPKDQLEEWCSRQANSATSDSDGE